MRLFSVFSLLTALLWSQSAEAMPPQLQAPGEGGVVNIKVRRITEIKPISTTAPPPATALKGKHRLLVVLVHADKPWPKKFRRSRFEELVFDKSSPSVREYYLENSYGLFELTGSVIGPIRVPGRMSDYRYSQQNPDGTKVRKLIEHAMKGAARKINLKKFDKYDARGKKGADGVVDHVLVIYAGDGDRPDAFSPIWPHRGSLDLKVGKYRIQSYTIMNHSARLGVYVHEFGHDIGLPDLYDRDYSSHGIGDWCTMASGSWIGQAERPGHISAWGKVRLGWIMPKIVDKPMQNVRIPSSSEKPFALKIPIGRIDSKEYFLLENRRKVGFDGKLPSQGILIWHIDENKGNNDDEKRKMVDVVEATRVQDLDHRSQIGYPKYLEDVFTGAGNDLFSDDTTPSARSNTGEPSRIRVKILTPSERVMTVDIDRPKIFNPGGIPYTISQDGYNFGRFATVPVGPGSEALVRLTATPGGYLVFAAEVFFSGQPNGSGKATIRLYKDRRGKPGKVLAKKTIQVKISQEGYTQARARLAPNEKGLALSAHQKVWVGVVSDDGRVYPAMNPFSTTKKARYRSKRKKALKKTFNLRGQGRVPVSDYIIRLSGFGYLSGSDRPEPLANEDDPLVVEMKKVDAQADGGQHTAALRAYESILQRMEKDSKRYETWIPVVNNSVGVMAYELKKYDVAVERFESSLRRAEAAKDQPNMADIYENLGETHFFAKDFDKALVYCNRSKTLNGSLKRLDRLVENLFWLGRANQEKGEKETARPLFEEALAVSKRAFPKDADQEEKWRVRIAEALRGKAKDESQVKERAKEVIEKDTGKKQKAVYTDLLQFLADDIEEEE